MRKKTISNTFSIYLLLFFTISSCGFIDDSPDETKQVLSLNTIEESCELDTKQLSLILEQNIAPILECIESKLLQFSKVVHRKDQNYIDYKELNKTLNLLILKSQKFLGDNIRQFYK